jgi:parallel beta-helix repeat protein
VAGSGCRIASCGSENNAQLGYTVGADCTFTSCTARGNQLSGFRATGGATLTACVSTLNNSHGFEFTQVRNSARDCGSYFNGGNGFVGSHSTRLEGCHADNNTQSGITLADYCSVRSCDATQNGSNGMNAGLYAQVLDCNSSLNAASGIVVTDGGVVRRCSASGNTGMGIAVFVGTTVEGCEVRSNTLDGIRAITSCYVLNNTADNNGGNAANGNQGGIRVEGVANRVEGNSLTGNDFSIYTSAATSQNNFFGRNTSRSPVQGHYQIVPGNSFGPIVAVSGVGDISTVNGAGYPMANFTY